MKKNILNSIRKSKFFSFFIIGMLSNVVVFAEPATQAVFNFSAKQNTKYWHSTSYRIALNSEITKKNYNSKLFENNDLGRSHPSQEGLWHVQVDADRDSGRIGVKTEGANDFIQDNFFNFFIPDSIDLSTHHTFLSYELFGVLSEEGTTKSINGSKAYGGKTLNKDQHWKKVEEYLPQTLLKNGNNEIFFNRSIDSIYEYEIKNVSLKLYNEFEETFIQSKINHERIFNIEKDFVSTKINLQDATDSDLSFYGISLKPEKHLENEVVIEVSGLPFKDVKPLDQDLLNVTAGDFTAYRVQAIDSVIDTVELFLAYDFHAIPEGYSSKDIRTYFFDKVNKSWKALPVARIDSEKQQIISLIPDSEEGVDYINGIIKVPEQPETTNFTPTAIKDIEFANPVAGVVSIPPPTANNNGTVNTSFPVKLPPGRSGMQPSVEVVYNSEGGNGWMGVGWNLDIPSLTLNTKWGVPIFDPELESEVYTLNGQDLVFEADGNFTAAHRDLDKKRVSERTFYLRKEGSYLKIIRHGNSTSNYWWEVIDKLGNKSFYGGFSGISQDHILRDNQGASGNIVHWALIRQEDQYGNYIEYNYDKQWKTLSGGISGWTFSIKNIKYTLHALESQNFFQIDFIRNSNRNDVITSARTGVIQIVDELLDEIIISYKEGTRTDKIRSYHFDYSDGPFRKKHLVKISEYDSADRLFYSNTLEYFEADENEIISDVVEEWSGSNDDVSSVLRNIATGGLASLIPTGSVLGTNVSNGFSFGMRAGVGVGSNGFSVANTIGGSFNYQAANQETRISFMDINGDGLPDKIYTNSSRVYYRPNIGDGFGNRIQIDGINNLSKTKSRTNGFGVDANLFGLVGVGASTSKTKSITDNYFVDINGDGLPDMISKNRVKFNTTRANSDSDWRSFSHLVEDSENPIEAGMIDPDLISGFELESLDELRALHPQFDHVKVWQAPYSGNINISGTAQLLEKNECNSSSETNDFRITIERSKYNNTVDVVKKQILSLDSIQTNASINSIQKGDYIFFRIHNMEYGCGGEVAWDPIISYTFGAPSGLDEQGKQFNLYQANENFIMNNGKEWEPESEDYNITIYFNLYDTNFEPYQFSDDIDFIIEKIGTDITTGESWIDSSWTKTRTLNHETGLFYDAPNALTANLTPVGDIRYALRFYAKSDSNVNWDELQWKPAISGSELYYPAVNYLIYDDNMNQSTYQISANTLPHILPIPPGEEEDPVVVVNHNLFSMPTSKNNMELMIHLHSLYSNEELPLKVNWLIKEKAGTTVRTIYKRTFYLMEHNRNFVFSQSPSSYIAVNTSDEEFLLTKEYINHLQQNQGIIYSAFFVENNKASVFDEVEIVFENHPDAALEYPMIPEAFQAPMMAVSPTFYGISYRGWGQFLYNGGLDFTVDEEGDLILDSPPSTFEGPIDMEVFANSDPDIDPDDIQDQIDNLDPNDIEINGEVVRYLLYSQNNEDRSYGLPSVINSFYGSQSNGNLTVTLGRFGENDLYDIYIDEDDLLNGNPGLFIGFSQMTESKGKAVSGELVTVTGTESKSTSKVLNQYIDLNGDRYPDIVTKKMIQFTGMDGALSSKTVNNSFVSGSKNEDRTVGVTIASMQPNSDTKAKFENPVVINTQAGINSGSGMTFDAYQWYDMNGDGLPDQVLIDKSSVKVRLNTGYGFSDEINWAVGPNLTTSTRENVGVGVPFKTASFAFGFGGGTSTAEVQTLLMDVNGDGLPDLIINNGSEYKYYLNTGNSIDMTSEMSFCNSPSIERDLSVSGNIYAAATVGFSFFFLKFTFSPSVGTDASFSEKVYTVQDIDGDGLPDLLYKTAGTGNGSVHARLNQVGKSHLLKKVNTPLGGHWEVDYRRVGNTYDMPQSKWVMKELKTYDGFTGDNEFALDRSLMKFSYQNGKQDRRERDFYGFETLKSELCHPDTEEVLRSTVQRFHTGNYYLAGKLKETLVYNAQDERLNQQKYFYNLRKPDVAFVSEMNTQLDTPFIESGMESLDRTRVFTPLVKTISTQYEENQTLHVISEMSEYDAFGNITKFIDFGIDGDDAFFTKIKYDHNFKGLPTDMSVYALSEPSVVLRKRMANYNTNGKIEELITQLDEINQNTVVMDYDGFGNIKTITHPQNRNLSNTRSFEVQLEYDAKIHTYPVEISNSFDETSTYVYDYFYGIPVLQTDINGNSIRTRIDQRGRPIEIAGPYEYSVLGFPSNDWIIRKEYPGELPVEQQILGAGSLDYRIASAQGSFEAIDPGSPEPDDAQHVARTRHRDPRNTGNEFLTLNIVDGFGQAIQLKKTHFIDGTTLVWQISGKEKKDVLGRITEQYLPITQNFSAQNTEYVNGTGNLPPVNIRYDDKDREIEITQPGESSSTEISYSLENNLLKTEVVNELNQTQTNYTDVRGRLHKTVVNDVITTRFFYNAINEQIKVRDQGGNETEYVYDLAGRRIEEHHPDRGSTLLSYDNANRLIKKQTANALEQGGTQAIEYKYDFGRLVELNYPENPENNVSYEYGSPTGPSSQGFNVGRLISQNDATGMQFFSYGKLGELTKQQRAVAVAGKTFYWFETEWEYDSWGRIKKITYPDKEEVTYYYDLAGQLQSVGTNLSSMLSMDIPKKIVENITYTELGERKSIAYGNGTINTYSYDTRRRLNNLKHTFSEFSMERQYQYDPLSNITGIFSINATNPSSGVLGGPVEHFYEYDHYNRLVYAEGFYVGPDDEVPDMLKQAYSLNMEYDLSHNILEKDQVHQFGSVTSINQTLPTDARHALTSYKLEYTGYGSSAYAHRQPHAPRKIIEYPQENFSGDPEDPRIKRKHIDYDANGNQIEIREEVKDPERPQGYSFRSMRKNLWDEEDRLRAVDLDPESDSDKPLIAVYTYDAGGERTIKYVPARIDARYSAKEAGSADRLEAMIYPNALLTAKILPIPEGGFKGNRKILKYTKHYYIGSERIASFLGTRQSVGLYCDQETTLIAPLDAKVLEAGQVLEDVFRHFDKTLVLDSPHLYGNSTNFVCGPTQLTQHFGAYWYHPDHLGSSSYITNLDGEINQHMEYLPFGETLVEEHLNSNNSPYKFNAKEYDSETGNYYYGARYYDPKWSAFLTPDPALENYPGISPYAYTLNNPVRYVDPTGMYVESPDNDYGYDKKTGALKLIKITNAKYDHIYSGKFSEDNKFDKDHLLLTINKGTLVEEFDKDFSKEGLIFNDLSEGLKTMKTLSFKTEIEFAAWAFKDDNDNKGLLVSPWFGNTDTRSRDYFSRTGNRVGAYGLLGEKIFAIHTHSSKRGGFGMPSDADKKHFKHNPNLPHYILSRNHGITRYNQKSVYTVKDLNKYF